MSLSTWVISHMHHIDGRLQRHRGSSRAVVRIAVFESEGLQCEAGNGLIDTGALRTAVSRSLVARLGLRPNGQVTVNNATGTARHTLYNFRLGFDLALSGQPPRYVVVDEVVQGMDWADHPDFDVLIGMDVIARGDLAISRDGRFVFDLP